MSGDLFGDDDAAAATAPLPDWLLVDDEAAAWPKELAELTIDWAADNALARVGLELLDDEGAKTAAKGDEAAADTTLEARLEAADPAEAELAGRVWM